MSDITAFNETGTTALAPPPREVTTRWATEVYAEAVDDFQQWLLSEIYYKIADRNNATGKVNTMAEAVAEACLQQLTITHNLREVTERALIAELWTAQQTRWYTVLGSKYSSLAQVLGIALKDASESERYDLLFWMEYLLPALEYMGQPVESVLNIPENFSKARAGVPHMRNMWKQFDSKYRSQLKISSVGEETYWTLGSVKRGPFTVEPKEGETRSEIRKRAEQAALADYRKNFYLGVPPAELDDFGRQLADIISMITSDQSVNKFKEEIRKMEGREPEPPAPAWMFQVGKGMEYILIQCNSQKQTTIIASRLNDLVTELGVTDPMHVVEIANNWFASTRRKHNYYTLDIDRCRFVLDGNRQGIELIDPDALRQLAQLEFAKAIPYIMQALPIYVGILEICPVQTNTTHNILRRFALPDDLPQAVALNLATAVIPDALVDLYGAAIHQAATTTLPRGVKVTPEVIQHVTGFVTLSALCQAMSPDSHPKGDTVT